MTTTYRESGQIIEEPSASQAYTSGVLYMIGGTPAVAKGTYAVGEAAVFYRDGVHELPLNASAAAVLGEPAYWDETNEELTDDPSGNPYAGRFHNASTGTTAWVKLEGSDADAGADTLSIDNTDSPYALAASRRDTFLQVDTSGGAVQVDLPDPANIEGRRITVKKTTGDVNAVTLETPGSETIDGAANHSTLDAQWDSLTLISDGVNYLIENSTIA